jgi:TPR repeat protein
MYSTGQGVPQDNKTAVKWWKLAAEQGDAEAQKLARECERKKYKGC